MLHDLLRTFQFELLLHVELLLSLLFLLKLHDLLLDDLFGLLLDAHNVAHMLVHLRRVLLVQFLADEALPVQHLQEPSLAHVHGSQVDGALLSHVFIRVVDVVEELGADQNCGQDDSKKGESGKNGALTKKRDLPVCRVRGDEEWLALLARARAKAVN